VALTATSFFLKNEKDTELRENTRGTKELAAAVVGAA
jgi:hypothetical protein